MIEDRIFRVFLYVGAKNSTERTILRDTAEESITNKGISDTHDYIHVYT